MKNILLFISIVLCAFVVSCARESTGAYLAVIGAEKHIGLALNVNGIEASRFEKRLTGSITATATLGMGSHVISVNMNGKSIYEQRFDVTIPNGELYGFIPED